MTFAPIVVREVWEENLEYELQLIRHYATQFPTDNEFLGLFLTHVIFPNTSLPHFLLPNPTSSSNQMSTYSNSSNSASVSPMPTEIFPISEPISNTYDNSTFTISTLIAIHDPESISLLKNNVIDFLKNKYLGNDPNKFGLNFHEYGLGPGSGLTWITNYVYLIKILTPRHLPNSYKEFMMLMHYYFGLWICDVKPMEKKLGYDGCLEMIAKCLKLHRAAGKTHQASFDSLLIMQVYLELMKKYFPAAPIPILHHNNSRMPFL